MPEIDHRIGKGLECVMQLTETIKAKQEPPELSALTGTDPLLLIEADPLGAQIFVPRSLSPHGQTGRHERR